jgi:flagellar biosynthesis/type III secretory pathway protein FliH
MSIRIIGNDIEINGEKVARILDIRPTLLDRLIAYIEAANTYSSIVDEILDLKDQLSLEKQKSEEAYDDGKNDGYAEGKEDGKI